VADHRATGTLTRNEMTIQRIVTRSGEVEVTGIGGREDRLGREAGLLTHVQQGRDVRILFAVADAFGPERAQVDQTADVRDVDPGAPGNVLDRELQRRPLLRTMMAEAWAARLCG
jgi:magnesium-transporting ATPase (P-type)